MVQLAALAVFQPRITVILQVGTDDLNPAVLHDDFGKESALP